jgi:hypothetical protein
MYYYGIRRCAALHAGLCFPLTNGFLRVRKDFVRDLPYLYCLTYFLTIDNAQGMAKNGAASIAQSTTTLQSGGYSGMMTAKRIAFNRSVYHASSRHTSS